MTNIADVTVEKNIPLNDSISNADQMREGHLRRQLQVFHKLVSWHVQLLSPFNLKDECQIEK